VQGGELDTHWGPVRVSQEQWYHQLMYPFGVGLAIAQARPSGFADLSPRPSWRILHVLAGSVPVPARRPVLASELPHAGDDAECTKKRPKGTLST
jgi:hypothetical protein